MFSLFIIADETDQMRELCSGLVQGGFACSIAPDAEKAVEQLVEQAPDLVLVNMAGSPASSRVWHLPQWIKQERRVPVIALISRDALDSLDSGLGIDDFVVEPWDATEVALRAKRVLGKTNKVDTGELIECGDLVIDLAKCEVSVKGRLLALTFKEYELLRFLASNKGRVFTREAVLNKVWGYDYYGGDRTVDVHIRRLRSKIEDRGCFFIETVRNIGYKFKENL